MRAEYVPTADQRALVENAAVFGITQADIAEQLKIDEKTRSVKDKPFERRTCSDSGLTPAPLRETPQPILWRLEPW